MFYQKVEPSYFIIRLKITPNSSRDQILGIMGNKLKISLQAPPENNKANQALLSFLAKFFKISKKDVIIISGQTSPNKMVQIQGAIETQLQELCKS